MGEGLQKITLDYRGEGGDLRGPKKDYVIFEQPLTGIVLGSRHRAVSCTHAVTEVPMQHCREEDRPVEEEECSVQCVGEVERKKKERSVGRCEDVLDSSTCQKYSLYCGVRISFTKRCCNTCFQRFRRRQRKAP